MEPRNVLFVGSEDAERTVALAGALADLIATTGWSPRLAVAVAGVSTGAGEAGAERVHDLESDDGPLARADVVVTDSTESAADLVTWQAMRGKHVIAVDELTEEGEASMNDTDEWLPELLRRLVAVEPD